MITLDLRRMSAVYAASDIVSMMGSIQYIDDIICKEISAHPNQSNELHSLLNEICKLRKQASSIFSTRTKKENPNKISATFTALIELETNICAIENLVLSSPGITPTMARFVCSEMRELRQRLHFPAGVSRHNKFALP